MSDSHDGSTSEDYDGSASDSHDDAPTSEGHGASASRDATGVRADVGRDETSTVLELDGVSKAYGSEVVIRDLSLSVREGEILTVLGPSGCGKTTTLRLVAGLERPDSGVVRLRGDAVAGDGAFVAPERRDVGVVFQNFALFPHMTAAENVAFGLKDRPEAEREARVEEMLDLVDLADQRGAYPDELSGGQQQRIALARSLAPEPEMLLLDEPFSNLDVDLRVQMREEVRAIIKEAGVTAVSVTHDQEEAMSVSDRVAVMQAGRIVQVGEPEQVFQHPESRFVAGFLGHASFLSGFVSGDRVETALGGIPREQIHGLAEPYDKTRIDVLVRPDDLRARVVAANEATPVGETDERTVGRETDEGTVGGEANEGTVGGETDERTVGGETDEGTTDSPAAADGRVVHRRYLGPTVLYRVELDDGDVVEVMHNHTDDVPLDAPVEVELAADHDLAWFPKGMDAEPPLPGEEVAGVPGAGDVDPDRDRPKLDPDRNHPDQATPDGGQADGDSRGSDD